VRASLVLAIVAVLATGCAEFDVGRLSSDEMAGRNNNTPGSLAAREFIRSQLEPHADPIGGSYFHPIASGTNVLAVVPGTDLADEYVIVGAHYDHVGSCTSKQAGDTVCNGATDNATGVAAALQIARNLGANPTRRSVIIALWDREEDGLLGSAAYVQAPVVPLADTVGYVNFDIQGSNLLPALRNTTFAVGPESGGTALQQIVRDAAAPRTIDTTLFSSIFGQARSDYWNFIGAGIPTVFYTDSTGPCYHTNQDEFEVTDFKKLYQQIASAQAVTRRLADMDDPPQFVSGQPLATYQDLVAFADVVDLAVTNIDRFTAQDQATILDIQETVRGLADEGEAAFDSNDVSTLIGNAASAVNLLTRGSCDGFLSAPPAS
jgi:hypothetical protein